MATNSNAATNSLPNKPIPLRAIFILNGLKMFLPFIFYYVFTTKDISIDGLDPKLMLYTGVGYILTFAIMVFSILKQKLMGVRIASVLDIIISLPAKAYIGIVIAIISLILSFNKKVLAFFNGE